MKRGIAGCLLAGLLVVIPAAGQEPQGGRRMPDPAQDREAFTAWQGGLRQQLREMLGIPAERVPLAAESRGLLEHDGIVIEKWIYTSEPGSRVPALLYRPEAPRGRIPAIVFTYGHGSSKSSWPYQFAAQVYAKLGLACLAIDPIGEEERNKSGGLGTRAHDAKGVHERSAPSGRLIMGKLVFDTMRGVDFLLERSDIDPQRIGVAGYSLGGAKASWMAALDPRLKLAIVAGWAYDDITINTKLCTRIPNERMRRMATWPEFLALSAPHCAVFIPNGDADVVIDRRGDGSAWSGTRQVVAAAAPIFAATGAPAGVGAWFEPGAGHRPFFAYEIALEWIHLHLGTPGWTMDQLRALGSINAGRWCDQYGIELERLYGTELHWRGATLPDLGIQPLATAKLAVLRSDELGTPDFTLEGWLERLERK